MPTLRKWLLWGALGASVISWAWTGSSAAPHPAGEGGPFVGQTITYIVCTGPGGGYDTYARLIGKYLGKNLGARVVVRNVPGAAHLIGVSQLNAAPADGLTIGTFTAGLLYLQLTGANEGHFDLNRMSWIGKAAAEPRVLLISADSEYRSIADLQHADRPLLIATEGAAAPAHLASKIVVAALGLRARLVPGFGEDEAQLAVIRGEVTGVLASPTSLRAVLERGYGRSVFRIGPTPESGSDVPSPEDVTLTEDQRQLLQLVALQAEFGRLTAAPPGVPADRLDALRDAYTAAVHDPAFLEEARRLRLPIEPLDGERLAARVAEALSPPAHVLQRFRELVRQ